MPKISIVTVSFNQALYIEKNILSILVQDYPNLEHIVVDGGSTDQTIEILKKYPHLKWVSEKDSGQTNGMNKGLRMATGDIIQLLNSDDMSEPGTLKVVSQYFIKHPEAQLIYGDCRIIDMNDRELEIFHTEEFDLKKHLNLGNMLWQEATFFRKEIIHSIGYLNEQYRFAMDYDYWCRAARIYKFHKIDRILGNFRLHSLSKTGKSDENYRKEAYAVSVSNGGAKFSSIYFSRYGAKLRTLTGETHFSKFSRTYNSIKNHLWNAIHTKKN
ncbi:Dolichyl N-acetyl-alpha-D-glucosaminyl phosphate 3-beta-D-2,3-diacetamido-2,3-dideoxy-beta-D-glucuronosyltransferase [Candidatus Bilamarchaeum dharawalense]|uniref:Dolichyl N-acetyl-alpha-D-glucosaminyl phosphate 3-beta-D-2,3-diacetamido-2,3-dideoxy-beta-D-glucuronosyltransferase n=1 Tax=Candidatus Bilamarchaeum dharawalense TaxID=2885759 RepID=A0A5E4LX90_9ARCH|nr:Dolichyl N-acetyl-alpha-D-glucosaminyl phosphate 3-beta-D-2,3-diacetamido-2,3-dideoxy-beta-D-glucuronosyltransferase [Candidatus Bilamarchaeum dharawalense]